jgi:hypothetical protein
MGTGRTAAEAKTDGFRNAVTMRVGSAILSENEVANNQLVREDIVDYSAGYIYSYAVVDTITRATETTIIMDVVVRSSKIHERILSKSRDEKKIDGSSLAVQYSTYLTERKKGDVFLETILNDYPKRAFTVTQGKHEFKLYSNRNSVLVIPFEMRWNDKYIVAISEALKLLEDGTRNSASRVVVNRSPYYFNDASKYNQVRNKFISGFQLQADIIDNANITLLSRCYSIDSGFSGTYSEGIYVLYGNERLRQNIEIVIDPQTNTLLGRAARVDVSVTANCMN